jgi:hypothetical protein
LGDRWEIAISTYPEGRRISLPRIIASLGAVSRPVTVIVSGVPIADGFDYAEGNAPHCQGFAVLSYRDGVLMPPDLCSIVNGRAWFRGGYV